MVILLKNVFFKENCPTTYESLSLYLHFFVLIEIDIQNISAKEKKLSIQNSSSITK